MKFCKNCGASVPYDAVFCQNCGAKIEEEVLEEVVLVGNPETKPTRKTLFSRDSVRKEEVENLAEMMDYFVVKSNEFEEYDHLNAVLSRLNTGTSVKPLVFGCILLDFPLLFVLIAGLDFDTLMSALIMSIIPASLILMYFIKISTRKKQKKYVVKRIEELTDELVSYYSRFTGVKVLGIEYCNPKVISQIYDVIRIGRADTTKEAINCLLEDSHRSMMELQASLVQQDVASIRRSNRFIAATFFLR